ncbi:hypothetical protein Q9233_012497 [Columba guinea]|nr:hypothetical protein Q9233_012497 [Columba guinea]
MPLAQLAEPWPNMELVQLDTENGQAAPEEGGNPPAKLLSCFQVVLPQVVPMLMFLGPNGPASTVGSIG